MSYPVVQATATGASGGDVTTHVVTLPSGIVAGQLLVVFLAIDSNPATSTFKANPYLTWPSGWFPVESLGFGAPAGSRPKVACAYKIATGSDSLTVTSDAAERSVHVSYRISNFKAGCIAPLMVTWGSGGSSTGVTFQTLVPTGAVQEYLCLNAACWDNGTITPSAGTIVNADGSATGVGLAITAQNLTAYQFSPTAITLSAATYWITFTLVVLPEVADAVVPSFVSVKEIDWAVIKQNSGAMRPSYWARPPWGSNPVDPDYPRILESEAVKTITLAGRNVLTTDRATGEDAGSANVNLFEIGPDGPAPGNPAAGSSAPGGGWWDGTCGQIIADYQLDDTAWGEGAYDIITYLNVNNGDGIGVAASLDPGSSSYGVMQNAFASLELRYYVMNDTGSWRHLYVGWHPLRRVDWTNKRVRFTMTWQCGTPTMVAGDAEAVAPDGYILLDMTDLATSVTVRVFNLQGVPLIISDGFDDGSPGLNYLNGASLGSYGLWGHHEHLSILKAGTVIVEPPPEVFLKDSALGLTWVEFTPKGET